MASLGGHERASVYYELHEITKTEIVYGKVYVNAHRDILHLLGNDFFVVPQRITQSPEWLLNNNHSQQSDT